MKTFIFSLGIFALFVSPASCSKGKLLSQNTYTSTDNSFASKEDDESLIIIDPTKPIPKP